MAKHDNCPFCNVSERILLENSTARAFLSNPRKVPGHTIVVPKRHVEKPWELKPEELQDVFALIFSIEQKLIGKVGDGCDLRQNYRPFMQQSRLKVDHIHFQVIPRYNEDYLYKVSEQFETDLFSDLDPDEEKEIAKLLK